MDQLLDLQSWSLSTPDLLQNLATLSWINNDDREMIKHLTTMRVGYELWSRLSGERELEALRAQTILKISQYVKSHPNASKEELSKEIGKQIWLFQEIVDKM